MSAGDMIPYCAACNTRHYGVDCPRPATAPINSEEPTDYCGWVEEPGEGLVEKAIIAVLHELERQVVVVSDPPRGCINAHHACQLGGVVNLEGIVRAALEATSVTGMREALEHICKPLSNPPDIQDGDKAEAVIRWWREVAMQCREIARKALA